MKKRCSCEHDHQKHSNKDEFSSGSGFQSLNVLFLNAFVYDDDYVFIIINNC